MATIEMAAAAAAAVETVAGPSGYVKVVGWASFGKREEHGGGTGL